MLFLKRNIHFNEVMKCSISKELIIYGDYYYEDDEDGAIIKATVYAQMKKEQKEAEFNFSRLNRAEAQRDYEAVLKEYEREYLQKTILDRPIAGKEGY